MSRLLLGVVLFALSVGAAEASSPVIAWTSDTSYIVFDGTVQANIIGSGTVASGSSQLVYGRPQIETSALLTGKAISTGVAATDASIGRTITSVGTALAADVATGAACSGGGLWGFIGCTALSAITQAAVFLGVDKLWNWLFGSGTNTVTYSPPALNTMPSSGFLWYSSNIWGPPQGGNAWPVTYTYCSTDPNAVAQGILKGLNNYYVPYNSAPSYSQGSMTESDASQESAGGATYADQVTGGFSGGSTLTIQQTSVASGTCTSSNFLQPLTAPSSQTVTVGGAVSALPSSELSGAADPQTTADMINAAWQQAAAQSGYAGVPYPSTDPIQASDVSTWESNNPGFAPTLGDDLGVGSGVGSQGNGSSSIGSLPTNGTASDGTGPNGTGSTSSSTGTSTGASGTTGTGTGTSTGASGTTGTSSDTADLCATDPTASACAQLGTATAGTLPASSLSVSVSPWNIGPSTGTCPVPVVVSVFGASLSFQYTPICTFAQRVQPLVLALCALLAAFILVRGIKS